MLAKCPKGRPGWEYGCTGGRCWGRAGPVATLVLGRVCGVGWGVEKLPVFKACKENNTGIRKKIQLFLFCILALTYSCCPYHLLSLSARPSLLNEIINWFFSFRQHNPGSVDSNSQSSWGCPFNMPTELQPIGGSLSSKDKILLIMHEWILFESYSLWFCIWLHDVTFYPL